MNSTKILVDTLRGKPRERNPFWFMRQAGRYLPEYRALRSTTGGFLEFCYTPGKAAEATLQPIKRFGMDGAIIFSDILVVPHALGAEVRFEEGVGPRIEPVDDKEKFAKLNLKRFEETLAPVYEALRVTKAAMPEDTALIGFAGAPWTLACYMVEGRSSDFEKVKKLAENDKPFFNGLIALLTDAVVKHIGNQVAAGAEVIQLFDSWAGILNDEQYANWVVVPAKEIVAQVRKKHDVPVIAFPRQSGIKFLQYAKEVKPDGLSVDNSVPLDWIKNNLMSKVVVQGCLEPEILAGDRELMLLEAKRIRDTLGNGFVFNLSHGVLPHTPVENMAALCDFLREQ